MRHMKMQWNIDGSILAVTGVQLVRSAHGEEKEISVVHFYDPFGQYLRSLKVPGKRITSISWEYSGLRIALAVDSFIYFANVRPDYKWTFFASDVLAYAVQRRDRGETAATFWNTKTNEKYTNRLAIIDATGVLKLLELEQRVPNTIGGMVGAGSLMSKDEAGKLLEFERKDVWDVKWSVSFLTGREGDLLNFHFRADDNPELFAIMEKTRMYILRNVDPEEPITCSGYICNFNNLQIKAALLDDVMREPETPSKDFLVTMETKSLRDTRNILTQVGLADALQFVEDNPHPRLWKLVAEAALEQLEFGIAEKAFVRCGDYIGLQVLRRLQKLDDKVKQKAEVSAYFGQYELAEKVYLEADRKDLAIDLRVRLGDWFRVVQLIKSGGGGDDALLENAWSSIGDFYYERQKWSQAVTYYAQGRNIQRLVELYYNLEDYENLAKLVDSILNNPTLLKDVARKFASVGMCDQAVKAYLACGDVKESINTCVQLNQWNTAVELAEAHKFREIEDLLSQYAQHLLEKDRKFEAIQLYRKANYCQQSAKLLYQLAEDSAKANKDPLRTKKLYVLAALEVERYHNLTKAGKGGSEKGTSALDALLVEDATNPMDSKILDNAWRGAEAYHLYLLAQRQYYLGAFEASVRTAQHLIDYEDILTPELIYTLLGLVSFHAKRFGTCSRAFIKLEAMAEGQPEKLEHFESIAMSIFSK
ncbi:WD repeat-containing protein 35 [Rhizophlyctis rosea]|nr:WD repeat-containing protein 35 [Rhizophlyctis rosea]